MPPRDDENVDLPPIPDMDESADVDLPPIPSLPEVTPISVDMPAPQSDQPQSESNANYLEIPNSSNSDSKPIDLPATPEIEAAFKDAGFEKIEQPQAPQQDFSALVDKLSQVAELVGNRLNAEPQKQADAPITDQPKSDDGQQGQFREFIDLLRTLVDRITPQTDAAPQTAPESPTTAPSGGDIPEPIPAQEPAQATQTPAEQQGGDNGMADVVRLLERQIEVLDEFRTDFATFASELLA